MTSIIYDYNAIADGLDEMGRSLREQQRQAQSIDRESMINGHMKEVSFTGRFVKDYPVQFNNLTPGPGKPLTPDDLKKALDKLKQSQNYPDKYNRTVSPQGWGKIHEPTYAGQPIKDMSDKEIADAWYKARHRGDPVAEAELYDEAHRRKTA